MKKPANVYPFVPFDDLSNKTIRDNFLESRTTTLEEIVTILNGIPKPMPRITGATTEERILSIFLDDQYRLGPREFIEDERDAWLERIRFFTRERKPLLGIILGFPYKIPVPIKTNRRLPDLGELIMLHRLVAITEQIHTVYPPGMRIEAFTEGVFGKFCGVPQTIASAYRDQIREYVTQLGYADILTITDLADVEKTIPDFSDRYETKVAELKSRYGAGDPDLREMYTATFPVTFRIVSSIGYDQLDLMDVYNDALSDSALNEHARTIREHLKNAATEATFRYDAYHQTRYETGIMDLWAPHALYLTVSPKPGRLGILPIATHVDRLPYHGATVLDETTGRFTIEYLIDIRRRPGPFTPVLLKGDSDPAPFYYLTRS